MFLDVFTNFQDVNFIKIKNYSNETANNSIMEAIKSRLLWEKKVARGCIGRVIKGG